MKIVYFDGHCVLCNGFVDFLLSRNTELKFASLQGVTAAERLSADLRADIKTVIFECDGVFYFKSEAVIRLLALHYPRASWLWHLILNFAPKFLRDGVYDLVAKVRYLLFGRREICRLPGPQEKARILE